MSEVMNRLMRKDVVWVTDCETITTVGAYGLGGNLDMWASQHRDCFVQAAATIAIPNTSDISTSIFFLRPETDQEKCDRECREQEVPF